MEAMEIKNWLQAGVFGVFAVSILFALRMFLEFTNKKEDRNGTYENRRILEKLTDGMLDVKADTQWTREKINRQHVKLDDIKNLNQGVFQEMKMQTNTIEAVHRRLDKDA